MQTEQIHRPRKKKWIVIGIIALIVIIAAINITVIHSKKNNSTGDLKFASVTEKELSNTKLVAGQVVPVNMETFYPDPAKGKVKELFIKEGQEIEKGQKLFSYDNPELSIQLRQLEIDKKSAKMRSDQGNAKITSIKSEIQKAKDAKSPKEVIDPLEAQLDDLQFQQKTTNLEIEKNKLQEEDLQNKQKDLIIYSSLGGIVKKVNNDMSQSTAQTAGAQTNPVVQIASKDPFIIQGTLTELQKSQIQLNQPITVTAKAVSNKTWKGKITEISEYPTTDETGQSLAASVGQQTQNISYYNFKAVLDEQDGLSPGYHVSIQMDLSTKKMLVVPSSSISSKGDSRFVYVVKKNKLYKQTITTGIGDGNSTEVLTGLKVGEKVVKDPSANVSDGLEVKIK
ncbi:efflux RND transporter periplasmic adaptor subunit [Bacillus sp. EB600]|uniref:efflux RND transporter periplasmic adaptor subunit n=1 Tax=Bacillus sp. EB600 TaxID=2806345 RepID=UPI00210B6EF1|nr:efflux RND transporter periplasmic adaptor subunit [Bacillus sp. EB600]MCQ6278480.1 efflux RND transporter periplasmic adaptor subunit [Bacillus sp. EB600]